MVERHVNSFVDYLNTLRTQTEQGNAFCFHESRGQESSLQQFGLSSADTHTHTRLDQLVEEARRPDFQFTRIILTGDAGDGKTAACEQLATSLNGGPLETEARVKKRWELANWLILKDGSELNDPTTPSHHLESVLEKEFIREGRRTMLAINEGRLRSSSRRANEPLWQDLVQPALRAREGTDEDVAEAERKMREHGTLVINLRDRCLPANTDAFEAVLDSFTRTKRWEDGACTTCPARSRCHILENARSMRDSSVRNRVRLALVSAYDSGQALPYRRLQGLLAYAITAGYECAENSGDRPAVQSGAYASPEIALQARYYNVLVGHAATPHESTRPELLARYLQRVDPAGMPAPECDRLLSGAPSNETLQAAFGGSWCSVEARVAIEVRPDQRASWIRSLKRKAFFELGGRGDNTGSELGSLLARYARRFPYESYEIYDKAVRGERDGQDALRYAERVLVRGLNALDGVDGDSLREHQLDPQELASGVRFGVRFGLVHAPEAELRRLPPPPPSAAKYLEHRAPALVLFARGPQAQVSLRVDLGLFELLHAASLGFRAPQAFGTYLLDVQRFKERLIRDFGPRGDSPATLTFQHGTRTFRLRLRADGTIDVHDQGAR